MPYRPMLKNTGAAIANVGATIGGTIAGMPQKIAAQKEYKYKQEQRDKAWGALQKDASIIDIQYKAFKNMYKTRAQKLVEAGVMTQDEVDANLQSFPMPREGDKLDRKAFDSYIERMGERTVKLLGGLNEREKKIREKGQQEQLGMDVQEQLRDKTMGKFGPARAIPGAQPTQIAGPDGTPQFTETPITRDTGKEYIPGAKTQDELMSRMSETNPQYTKDEVMSTTGAASVPSEADKEKQDRLAKKEARLQDMNDYQEAMMNYRWATHNYKKTKDKRTLQQAEDRGKQAINKLVSSIENKQVAEIDEQIKALKNPQPPSQFEDAPPIDYDAIAELETQKKNLKDQIDQLNAEKKMFGAVKNETRAFSPTGKETSRTTVPAMAPSERGLSGGTDGWKQVGKYKIRQK